MTRPEQVSMTAGEPRHEWCSRCLKNTLVVVEIYAITSDAIHAIGRFSACEECGWTPYAETKDPPGSSWR